MYSFFNEVTDFLACLSQVYLADENLSKVVQSSISHHICLLFFFFLALSLHLQNSVIITEVIMNWDSPWNNSESVLHLDMMMMKHPTFSS